MKDRCAFAMYLLKNCCIYRDKIPIKIVACFHCIGNTSTKMYRKPENGIEFKLSRVKNMSIQNQ